MANHTNMVTIEGNLTRDPELRYTSSGTAVASFTVASNRSYKRSGATEWTEETAFVDVTAWSQLGENVAESLSKGAGVVVTGRLRQESWEDRDTGQKRSKLSVMADTVAASLRNATATVNRNERREYADTAPARSGGGRAKQDPSSGYGYDEEPF